MVITVQLERRITGTCIFSIVISKLRYWKKPDPDILLKIDKSSKLYLYYVVLSFCLPVCLRVKRGGESFFDAKKVVEREPELGYNNHSVITNNRVQEAVILYHYVDN